MALSISLQNFDTLPDSANIRMSDLPMLYGMSESSIRRRIKAGTIPMPNAKENHSSSRITTYNVGKIRQSLASSR